MSEDRLEIEVEGGWESVAGVEALAMAAAIAGLSSPSPLDGGKAGMGGVAAEGKRVAPLGAAAHLRAPATSAATPPPNPPPSRGRALGVTILLTTDEVLADLNGRFRNKPHPTNVLSFPAAPNRERHLGDIALAYETCVREAREQGKSIEHHLQHLVAHGVLHLLGYDHETEADALVMEELERRVLSGLGISDPYAWRGDDHG